MKTFWARLGSPDAISVYSFAFVVVLQTSGSLISSLTNFEGRTLEFLALRLLALGALGAVLALGHLALVRWAGTKPRPGITLATFVASVATGTAAFDALLVASSFTEEYRLGARLVTALPGVMTGLILVAILVASAKEQSRSNAQLVAALDTLVEVREETEARVAQRHRELIEKIRRQVGQQVSQMGMGRDDDRVIIRNLLDDVVRPLSYALGRGETDSPPVQTPQIDASVAWPRVFAEALYGRPFHPLAVPLVLGVIGASFLIVNFKLFGVLAVFLIMASTLVLTGLFGTLWRGLRRATPLAVRFVVFSTSIVPVVLVTAALA